MATIHVSTSLPNSVISSLRNNGAVVDEKCRPLIIEVTDTDSIKAYDAFLTETETEADPILIPHFGNPAAQYVQFNVQLEVYQLLAAYQPLVAADFAPGLPPPPLAPPIVPIGGGV